MRFSSISTGALALTLTLAFATTGSAQLFFFDDFDTNPAGAGEGLLGHMANTGQVWGDGHFGVEGQPHILDVATGQGGTKGAGRAAGQNKYNHVPLDPSSTDPSITGGTIFVDVDFHREGTGEIQFGLSSVDANGGWVGANGPNYIWHDFDSCTTNGGTAPCIEIQGIASSTYIPVQFATGNMHIQMEADLSTNTGTLRWFDLDDPTNPARSGEVPLPFNSDSNPAGDMWEINALWLATTTTDNNGVDNVCVGRAGECNTIQLPDPATDFEWNSADSGDWNTADNWAALNGGAGSRPPGNQTALQSSEHTATFGDAIGSASRTVFTDSAVTVNSISFNNTMGGSYSIAGGPSVDVNASTDGTAASVGVAAGAHEFQVPFGILSPTTSNVVAGAQLTFNHALNLNGQTLTKTGAGTLTVNNMLHTGGGTLVGMAGTISGSGTVGGDLDNTSATVAPGNSPGVLSVAGNYTQGASGTLAIEIMGTDPGEGGHDQLKVTGSASLDGTLDIQTDAGFTPAFGAGIGLIGDSFVILTANTVTGKFSTVNGNHLGEDKFYHVGYNPTNVSLGAFQASPGDADGDLDVDLTDFNTLSANFDPDGLNEPNPWTRGNFDFDPDVDLTDFNLLSANFAPDGYGDGLGPGVVPEPASWALAVMALLAGAGLMGRR